MSIQNSFLPALILFLGLNILTGCGEKTVSESGTKLEVSQKCIDCHASQLSHVTGNSITEEWKLSRHNTSNAAGCADCHDPSPQHPNSGDCNNCHGGSPVSGLDVRTNPEADGKCDVCHDRTKGLFPTGTRAAHYNSNTSARYPASYVSSKYERNCRKCHNPHDTSSAMSRARDWANSGHGLTTAGARTTYDFKTMGSYKPASLEITDSIAPSASFPKAANRSVCVRCHTSTGYITYVTSGFKDLFPFAGKPEQVVQYNAVAPTLFATLNAAVEPGKTQFADKLSKLSPDYTREATHCNVCHDNGKGDAYGYKLRNVNIGSGAITYYNYTGSPGSKISQSIRNNKITFPDAGASNMCVVCHAGRENGDVIKMADARGVDFTTVSRVGSHSFVAAADLFRKSGFHFYSSTQKYQSDFAHDIIGLDQKRVLFGGSVTFEGLKADSRGYGPCIGCHVNSDVSHTFKPVNADAGKDASGVWINPPISKIVSQACGKCHTGDHAWTPDLLQAQKEGSYYALQALSTIITKIGLTSSTNWVSASAIMPWLKPSDPKAKVPAGQEFTDPLLKIKYNLRIAAYNMGAVYNLQTLLSDPGAFAHNGTYVKRLIYDSLDWIDNGKLDQSVNLTFTFMAKNADGTIINSTPPPNSTATAYNYKTLQSDLNALDTVSGKGWEKAYNWLLGDSKGNRP